MSILFEKVTYTYMKKSPFEKVALKSVDLNIPEGQIVGLIGHTGSGKSTLIQHINGLLKPDSGSVIVNGKNINNKQDLKKIRHDVGLVFQFPEHQLFEETVKSDICFGPINQGYSLEEANKLAIDAICKVGLSQEYLERSPFELSGGQKRRVAIAGILAMNPSILILDEPTAGLDPEGGREILKMLKNLHDTKNITIILVSHSMEEIAHIVDRIIVMNKGAIEKDGTPEQVFKDGDRLEAMGLSIPQITKLIRQLKISFPEINGDIFTVEAAKKEILRVYKSRAANNLHNGGVV